MHLLTLNEVADLLRKSPAQIRWMVHNGTAPRSAKIGGRRMWRETDVLAWVNVQFEESGQ
ncbi:helix-turn-helix transcriptional regulator [Arthrobacter bambusae]|uniref:helix-turn-helix transcriptional regulator n=1 Tax=Arthrobacter bambusae TaxID=1338426 RepID=UPI0027D8E92B|nr:helix-turn-helix domain-containing protein [Arthrobacter bambusae]